MKKLLFLITLMTVGFAQLQTVEATDIEKLKSLDGKFVSVQGKVNNTALSKTGKAYYINFNEDIKYNFSIVIFSRFLKNFTKKEIDPLEFYKDKTISVTGKIKIFNNNPEIIVAFPSQIKVIEEID